MKIKSLLFLIILTSGVAAVGSVNAFGEIDYHDNAFYLDDGDSTTDDLKEDAATICKNVEELNPQSNARASIIFSKKPSGYYSFGESAKITIKLQNWDTDDTKTEIICANASSETDTTGIRIILIEDKPDSNYFQILGFLSLHGGVSNDYNYGPSLQVNPDGDTLTVNFIDVVEREVKIKSGPWSEDDETVGARGSIITYSPALFPDIAEINCSAGFGGDTDGDFICNNWEPGATRLTITFNGQTYSGPVCTGGSPPDTCPSNAIKDVYVEVDARDGFAPSDAAIANLKNAFLCGAGSLNGRSCGAYPNVKLHVEKSDLFLSSTEVPDSISMPVGFNLVRDNHYGADQPLAKVQKSQVFHYSLFANQIEGEPSATGAGETWGDSILISLGSPSPPQAYVEGTFMHELGHNLNLWHGGNVGTNCKPNYISVMNYLFQLPDMSSRPLDYSQSKITDLNEGSLDENVGVGASVPAGLTTVFGPVASPGPTYRTSQTGVAINWDNDGLMEGPGSSDWPAPPATPVTPVGVDINELNFGGCHSASKTIETLAGFKDWATTAIKYNARNSGNFDYGAYQSHPVRLELNRTGIKQMQDMRASFIQYEISKSNLSGTSKTALDSKIADAKQLISVNKLVPAIMSLETTKNSLSYYTNDPLEQKKLFNLIEDFRVSLEKASDYVTIKFDSMYYAKNGTATITVIDPDANLDDSNAEKLTITILSGSDPNGISLTLEESDYNSAIFKAEVDFGKISKPSGNVLAADANDSILANYKGKFLASAFIFEEYVSGEIFEPPDMLKDKDLPVKTSQ